MDQGGSVDDATLADLLQALTRVAKDQAAAANGGAAASNAMAPLGAVDALRSLLQQHGTHLEAHAQGHVDGLPSTQAALQAAADAAAGMRRASDGSGGAMDALRSSLKLPYSIPEVVNSLQVRRVDHLMCICIVG